MPRSPSQNGHDKTPAARAGLSNSLVVAANTVPLILAHAAARRIILDPQDVATLLSARQYVAGSIVGGSDDETPGGKSAALSPATIAVAEIERQLSVATARLMQLIRSESDIRTQATLQQADTAAAAVLGDQPPDAAQQDGTAETTRRAAELSAAQANELAIAIEQERNNISAIEAQHTALKNADPDKLDPSAALSRAVQFEAEFWRALANVSKNISPATPDSIRHIYGIDDEYQPGLFVTGLRWIRKKLTGADLKWPSRKDLLVKKYQRRSIFFLFSIIILMIYYSSGMSNLKEIMSLESSLWEARNIPTDKMDPKAPGPGGTPNPAAEAGNNGNRKLLNVPEIIDSLYSSYKNIFFWGEPVRFPFTIIGTTVIDWKDVACDDYRERFKTEQLAAESTATENAESSILFLLKKWIFPPSCAKYDASFTGNSHVSLSPDRWRLAFWAQTILSAIANHLLPILFGLLGACAFTLRSLEGEISNWTLRSVSKVHYQLRLTLGALSGIAIGWILPVVKLTGSIDLAEKEPGAESGQPVLDLLATSAEHDYLAFGLAFVAGYGIELLFTFLDRVVGALGARTPSAPFGESSPQGSQSAPVEAATPNTKP